MKKILRRTGIILLFLFTGFSVLLLFSLKWALDTWPDLRMEEIIYELTAPLEGTGNGMIGQYIVHAGLPAFVVFAAICAVSYVLIKRGIRGVYPALAASSVLLAAFFTWKAWGSLHLGEWIYDELHPSTFIEDNYADPSETQVTFPEKKRNLVYIYLESLEMTFADEESGGAFKESCIPELTELALENESFAGNSGVLNGGFPIYGTTWTMGAMFGTTSGLPLKTSIGSNAMSTQSHFFPGIRTLGDILEDEGYNQTLLIGSEAKFGGRELYYTEHGHYKMEDYNYALDQKLIPAGYEVWWGYEDEKLFAFAKDTVQELAAKDEPFNLTILTVDTHFENGYRCRLCGDEFGDNKYANVMACSSRLVTEYVRWLMEQDFFENTTVIITGDHLTMDKDFCEDVPKDYERRVYTCYINAAAEPADPDRSRVYTTYDTFPTTVAALGAQIEGDRLGLGTNTFSATDTLAEKYGLSEFKSLVKQKSDFLEELETVDENVFANTVGATVRSLGYDAETGEYSLLIKDIRGLSDSFAGVRVYLTDPEGKAAAEAQTDVISPENTCSLVLGASREDMVRCTLTAEITDASGKTDIVLDREPNPLLLVGNDLAAFLDGYRIMSGSGKYAMLLSVRGDGSAGFTDETNASFAAAGLQADLSEQENMSYLAVITSEGVHEELGEDRLEYSGKLPGGESFKVVSKGGESPKSSIKIDGIEYSENSKGFNIVIFDEEEGSVIAKKYIDNVTGNGPEGTCSFETAGRFQAFGRIHVRVSDIEGLTEKQHRHVVIAYWYEDRPEEIRTVELTKGGADDYIGLIKGRFLASKPLHVQVYFVSTYQIWRTAGVVK